MLTGPQARLAPSPVISCSQDSGQQPSPPSTPPLSLLLSMGVQEGGCVLGQLLRLMPVEAGAGAGVGLKQELEGEVEL